MTIIITVPPLLPGLINSINTGVYIGGTSYLFNIAWLFGFFAALGVYAAISSLFPAKETFLKDDEVVGVHDKQVNGVEVGKGELVNSA